MAGITLGQALQQRAAQKRQFTKEDVLAFNTKMAIEKSDFEQDQADLKRENEFAIRELKAETKLEDARAETVKIEQAQQLEDDLVEIEKGLARQDLEEDRALNVLEIEKAERRGRVRAAAGKTTLGDVLEEREAAPLSPQEKARQTEAGKLQARAGAAPEPRTEEEIKAIEDATGKAFDRVSGTFISPAADGGVDVPAEDVDITTLTKKQKERFINARISDAAGLADFIQKDFQFAIDRGILTADEWEEIKGDAAAIEDFVLQKTNLPSADPAVRAKRAALKREIRRKTAETNVKVSKAGTVFKKAVGPKLTQVKTLTELNALIFDGDDKIEGLHDSGAKDDLGVWWDAQLKAKLTPLIRKFKLDATKEKIDNIEQFRDWSDERSAIIGDIFDPDARKELAEWFKKEAGKKIEQFAKESKEEAAAAKEILEGEESVLGTLLRGAKRVSKGLQGLF